MREKPAPWAHPSAFAHQGDLADSRGRNRPRTTADPAPLPIKGPERLSMLEQSLAVGFTWFRPEGAARYQGWPKVTPQSRAKKAPYSLITRRSGVCKQKLARRRLSRFRLLLMYSATRVGHAERVAQYMYRKKFFWTLFCMGNRIDMRRLTQPLYTISRI